MRHSKLMAANMQLSTLAQVSNLLVTQRGLQPQIGKPSLGAHKGFSYSSLQHSAAHKARERTWDAWGGGAQARAGPTPAAETHQAY